MNYRKYDAIFMVGPQGSGKGTQGKLLAHNIDFYYWEMGARLREEATKTTVFGQKVKALINAGHLLEDEELKKVLEDELPLVIKKQRILFDGVPRRVRQGQYLIHYLQQNGFNRFATIVIEIPKEESIKRLLERAHHEFRVDDTAEKIAYRLDRYQEETLPVIELLEEVGEVYKINGIGSVVEITNRINEALGVSNA
jgi:adenylate kinase